MTFIDELERLKAAATEGPFSLTDAWLFGNGDRKYPLANFRG